ncbi:IS607 family transposase [uncultured Lactobacillus sp.]|uniref:IS607 family transposase n=1 Tax=uncultured Lactobacillus sp. TaxID=153152 RepID=UPI00259BA4A9|nr:IS607 family transposase [uncultured Lactobacillus sp.]
MSKIYKVGEAAKLLGVSRSTMQRWDREKRLVANRNVANRRYYTQEQLDTFRGIKPHRKTVAYARVSSAGQKENLKHQMSFIIEYANARGIIIDEHIEDIGSGLNYNRKKWNKLLDEVEEGKIEQIFVTYKDRFARFGFDWFEHFCNKHNTKIIVLNNPETSPDEEMVDDLISVVHVFSCRLYGIRRYSKLIKQDLKKEGEKNAHQNQNISNQTQSHNETSS